MNGEPLSDFGQLMLTRILLIAMMVIYFVHVFSEKQQQTERDARISSEKAREKEIAREAAEVRATVRAAFPEAAKLMDELETAQDEAWLKANPAEARRIAADDARLRKNIADIKKLRESPQGRKVTDEITARMNAYLAKRANN